MNSSIEIPQMALVDELRKQSEQDAAVTPMDAVLDAARAQNLTGDQCFRLLPRLRTLRRMMYYVYGGWAQGINLNEYPPAVAYLFGKQVYSVDDIIVNKTNVKFLAPGLIRIAGKPKGKGISCGKNDSG